MHFRSFSSIARSVAALVLMAGSAGAQNVSWTDWTSADANSATGSLTFGATPVSVTFSGPLFFTQLGCGTDYWTTPASYEGVGVPNAPVDCDLIGLAQGGLKTIHFSQAVVNPLLAMVSWNGQPSVVFSAPIEVVNSGCGYWGCGVFTASGNTLTGSGEAHGTIRVLGTFTDISFTDGDETWHGITVGAEELETDATPEPASIVLLGTGLAGIFAARRRRKSA